MATTSPFRTENLGSHKMKRKQDVYAGKLRQKPDTSHPSGWDLIIRMGFAPEHHLYHEDL